MSKDLIVQNKRVAPEISEKYLSGTLPSRKKTEVIELYKGELDRAEQYLGGTSDVKKIWDTLKNNRRYDEDFGERFSKDFPHFQWNNAERALNLLSTDFRRRYFSYFSDKGESKPGTSAVKKVDEKIDEIRSIVDKGAFPSGFKLALKKFPELYELLDDLPEPSKPEKSGLASKLGIFSIISFLFALYFLSSNITGNVVGNLTNSTSNIIGGVCLIAGLTSGYFYFNKIMYRNNKHTS